MTVYIVTVGYEQHIEAVFSRREAAEKYVASHYNRDIHEWEVNTKEG